MLGKVHNAEMEMRTRHSLDLGRESHHTDANNTDCASLRMFRTQLDVRKWKATYANHHCTDDPVTITCL